MGPSRPRPCEVVEAARVQVDPEARTVVWPNGLDLAPDVLHGDFDLHDSLGFRDVTTKPPA